MSTLRAFRRRAHARPDEILDAALAVFETSGFDAARVEDVAARAGLSKAAVYLYFESKSALLQALIRRHVAPVAQAAAAMAAAGESDPVGTLRQLVGFVAHRLVDPSVFAVPRIVIGVAARFPDVATLYRTEVIDTARGALVRLIEAGIARGVFRQVDPATAAHALIGPLLFEGLRRHVFADPTVDADVPAVLDRQLAFVMAALGVAIPTTDTRTGPVAP